MANKTRYPLAAGILLAALLITACGDRTPDTYAGNFACTAPPAAEGQRGDTIAKVQTATVRAYIRSEAASRVAATAEQTCGMNQYTTGIMVKVEDAIPAGSSSPAEGITR